MSPARQALDLDATAILDLDLGGAKLIEASAGTGKTHTIADLYLRHILSGRQVAEILIVTFTNAATEELRGRIHRRLYQALDHLQGSGEETDCFLDLLGNAWRELDADTQALQLRRLQLALRCMDEASISTIHSFCQRSLQDHALSGNQLFDTEMLADDDPFWEAATRDWWRQNTYRLDRDTLAIVKRALGGVGDLTELLLGLRNRPSARLLPAPPADLDVLLRQPRETAMALHRLAPLWHRQRDRIGDILFNTPVLSRSKQLPYHKQNLPRLLSEADRFFAMDAPTSPFADFEYLGSEYMHLNSVKTKRGQDENIDHEFFRAVADLAATWQAYKESLGARLQALAYGEVCEQVAAAKRDRAVLAFQDQLTLLLQALDSDRGEQLAARLRRQFPVAMIDEFQDTDDIQYRIFSKLYLQDDNLSLTLIGDPKQAIYSFRGGDIFTYMQARSLPDIELFSLRTNWRSQSRLVNAVNGFFSHRPDAFIFSDSIDFTPVAAAEANRIHEMNIGGKPAPAMTLWQLPRKSTEQNFNRDEMRELINRALLAEITALLDDDGKNPVSIGDRPLRGGDIAILVRQAAEGHALSRVLQQHGIATVTIGRDSVFHSAEASGLFDLLRAVAQHQDRAFASLSLGSSLLGLDYAQIADIVDDDRAWQGWQDKLAELRLLWERHGFIAMFQSLLHRFDIATRLAGGADNERRITNLLHLAELLQQQSLSCAGISPLLAWFARQFDEPSREEAELRLEGDESLVRIVTIHKAKGLQYPVVFVPFLWSCRQVEPKGAVYFHDARLAPRIDLGSADFQQHWLKAEKERLAEDLRLLYVALTRARSRVYLAWGQAGSDRRPGYAGQTALAYLLHSRQIPADLDKQPVNGFPAEMDFTADLQRLVADNAESIELLPLPEWSAPGIADLAPARSTTLELAQFSRKDLQHWRINSFTGMTRGIHQPRTIGATASRGDLILDFPAGSHVGLLLHSLLENLDFQQGIETQCQALFPRFLPASGLAGEYRPLLLEWLENIVKTPLDGQALSLDRLSNRQRLNEFEFDFALDHLDIGALNRFMQRLSQTPLAEVGSAEFGGLITGVIDLVFEYRGRYYLVDYKSNFLGASLDDYSPANLQQAMLDRRYDLQSMIYTLALHRYLDLRLPDYDYERHFGGSYYLFLRAMRPQQGNRIGVHFERARQQTIETFDRLLGFSPANGVCP